jgi:hypothetical protein
MQFYKKANPEEISVMEKIIKASDWNGFKNLIKKVLGVSLKDSKKLVEDSQIIKDFLDSRTKDEIFIRELKKKEKGNPTRFINSVEMPDKDGYEVVYKPYGSQGSGFYYVKETKDSNEVQEFLRAIEKENTKNGLAFNISASEMLRAAMAQGYSKENAIKLYSEYRKTKGIETSQ